MKFNVKTKDLKTAMTTIKKVMYFKSGIPIFGHIRFSTAEESVGLVGTNLEAIVAEEIPADVEIDGELCIDFKQLEACIKGKKHKDHVTHFEERDGLMCLTVSGVLSQLSIMSVTEYPVIPVIETDIAMDLAYGIEKCLPFVSHEDTRMVLEGVHVHSKEHELVFAASDGRTLKVVRADPLDKEFAVTIPNKACSAIVSSFKGTINVGVNMQKIKDAEIDRQLRASCGNRELITKLLEGEFPDYESVLAPAKERTDKAEIELNREEFLEVIVNTCALGLAVKGKSVWTTNRPYPVWIEMVDGVMDISYNQEDKEVMQTASHTPANYSYDGYLLMAFNPRLLIRALESHDSPVISMWVRPLEENDKNEMGTVLDSVHFTDEDRRKDTVIMPMKPDGPKFGTDWVALKKEEEAAAARKEELDKAVAEMNEGSEDDGDE